MPQEQRHFTRIPFNASATLIDSHSGQKLTAEVIDISLKGVLVKRPADWQGHAGGHFTLHITLEGSDIEINLAVIAVHCEEQHIGFRIEHMELEAASHLHRLVELNLGDESLLERELSELVKAD